MSRYRAPAARHEQLGVMGELRTDTRIHVAGGTTLPGQVRLPELAGISPYSDPLLDRIGRLVQEHPVPFALAGIAGGVFGARSGAGLLASAIRGVGGAMLGLAGAFAIGNLVGRFRGDPSTTTAHVDQIPAPLPAPAGPAEQLRVMDWNVHALEGNTGVRGDDGALERLAAAVRRENPDVLVLQEMQVDGALGGVDDLARLAKELGATDAVLVPNGTNIDGTMRGQAILTFGGTRVQDARGLHHTDPGGTGVLRGLRSAITRGHDAGLPLPDLGARHKARTTTDAMLTTPQGRAVRLLNVHLSGTSRGGAGGSPDSTQRMDEQLVPLAATLDAWDGPTIMAGDFNVRAESEFGAYEASVLAPHGLRDALTAAGVAPSDDVRNTYSAFNPYKNLDRIYVSDDMRVNSARVPQELVGPVELSDHLPVVADVMVS